jgi:hypothetical protein
MIDAPATALAYLPLKFSRNKLSHTIEAADPDLTSRVGLKYYLDLQVPIYPFSEVMESLHTSEGRETPVGNSNGVQIFSGADFHYNSGRNGKIDGLLSYQKPRRNQPVMSVLLGQTMAFSLSESVKGGHPEVDTMNRLGKMYAIKAGLSNEDYYAYGENFFNNWQKINKQFLTWQPNNKRVAFDQEEYLHFVLNFTPKPSVINLRVVSYGMDGIGSNATTAMSLYDPVLYSVICCPASMQSLGLSNLVSRYDVWLANEKNQRLSEVRTYIVDQTPERFVKNIMFVNSLGGWDTMRLTGLSQSTLKTMQTTAEVERPTGAGVDFSELKIISIEGEYSLQVSTGFFKRDSVKYLKYLNELLLSEEVYLMTDKGHRPLQLTTSNLTDQVDNQDLVARTFSFRILDTVVNFSNLPAAQPITERQTIWRGLSLKPILDGFGKRTGYLAFERLEKVFSDDNSPVKPYTIKSNTPGDPDYLAPISSPIPPGSTPYPNTLISKHGSFNRSNCGAGMIGGPATITIAAGEFGGENPGDADNLAKSKFESLNNQAYADINGTCNINTIPLKFGILHKTLSDGSGRYIPVVDLRTSQTVIISNTTPTDPPEVRLSDSEYAPGIYNLIIEVEYQDTPIMPCKLKIPIKNREILVMSNGFFVFENVIINSSDNPLVIEVHPL